MGYIRHHAIVVTGGYGGFLARAREKALSLFDERTVSPIVGPAVNGYESFMVAPDGSKEGWDASAEGDAARDAFVAWLNTVRYGDGSSPLSWAVVQYGDDNCISVLVDHSDRVRAPGALE